MEYGQTINKSIKETTDQIKKKVQVSIIGQENKPIVDSSEMTFEKVMENFIAFQVKAKSYCIEGAG